ncbi:MAG: GEVED domain-containing protein, partial [Pirellulales bacterium]
MPSSTGGDLEVSADIDWFNFNAASGDEYTFETTLGTLADSTLTLFDTNGTTELDFDDDGGAGLASKIVWTAPANGTYYVQVDNYSTQTGTYTLDLSVVAAGTEDFGDAPTAAQSGFASSYPTLLADNGARHTLLAGFSIGIQIDTEADGQPNATADLDDTSKSPDDEDGVTFNSTLTVGNAGSIDVVVTNTAGVSNPYLDAWIDFNHDGDWTDSGEQIFSGAAVAGTNTLNFTVPAGALVGPTFARFRLHDGTTGLAVTGLSASGEVEDYTVGIATSGVWTAQGPGPAQDGQVENITPNDEVVGAIHTAAAHPTDPDILYIGAVNGGIWKTTNATAGSPSWAPLTDDQPGLSTGALEFDPTDATHATLVAGIGRFSSFGSSGGARSGLLRTTDGGSTWTVLDGGGTLIDKNISGVAARGSTIVASVNYSVTYGNIGIFRSTDSGASFTQVSGGSGLPQGRVFDLVGHPNTPSVLYASVRDAGTSNGNYKSTDTGANWVRVSNATMNALIRDTNPGTGATSNVEMAIHDNSTGGTNVVYVAILNGGQLRNGGVFRSSNGGSTWTAMDIPLTNEGGTDVGTNPTYKPDAGQPGGQGAIHFSIVADPTNPNIVYVGGDRQPLEFQYPTSIGAYDYSGRLFRGDATQPAGSQWVHLTHSNILGASGGGTASSSAPHADSREMVFDANGQIVEVDDGGVYRRTSPQNNTGDWFSIIGDLQVTESHDVAYDPISDILISGNQDTGSTEQISSGSQTWRSVSTGDGGDVAIDSITLAGSNQSIRYSSYQNLGGFRRRIVDNNNNVISTAFPALTVTGGGPAFAAQFDTPLALNAVDPTRIMFGGANGLYESTNQGDTIAQVSSTVVASGLTSNPIAYGGRSGGGDNLDVIYAGDGNGNIHVRTTAGGAFTSTDPDASNSDLIRDVRMDPDEWQTVFAINEDQVFTTTTAGASWTDITGDLAASMVLRSIEYIAGAVDAVAVGTNLGVFASLVSSLGTWFQFGTGLPNAPVWDMDYDSTDDVLAVGTLGRGVWTMPNASTELTNPAAVTVEDVSVVEGGGLLFTVTLDKAVQGAFDVNVSLADVTATGGATPLVTPEDYDNGAVTLNFAGTAGETKQFTVNTLDDVVLEGTETFTVNLSATNTLVTDSDTATGTITDNDSDTTPPTVESMVVADGTQRSIVKQVVVTFDGEVIIDSGAFTVNKEDAGGGAVGGVVATPSVQGGKTVVTLTFTASSTFVDANGSLVDGNYKLTIDATKVRDAA